jgi:Na+-driven multidrug efflux pump
MMLVGLAIFQLTPGALLSMFNIDESIIHEIGEPALRTISISFIFAGFSIICSAVFQALGHSIFSMFVSIGRQLVTLIPVAYLLSLTGNVNNVWWAFPIAEVVCVALSLVFYLYLYNRKIKTIPDIIT